MLKINYIGEFNPFDWDAFRCPVCRKSQFESISHTGVFCGNCNAQFKVRCTGGDPGCVVDCLICPPLTRDSIYAPLWKCEECGAETALFEWQEQVCPSDQRHTKLRRVEHVSKVWEIPDGFPPYFYLILKRGEYCSGWLRGNDCKSLNYPTQEEWDEFQQRI